MNAGDINGDGKADIIVTAPNINMIYVIYGSASLSSFSLTSFSGNGITITGTSGTSPEYSISSGDVNNDGYDDIIIGASKYQSNTGIIFIIYGGGNLPATIDLTNIGGYGISITGEGTNYYTGRSVGRADVNGDGYADVIIGAPYCLSGMSCPNPGKAYLVFGSNDLSNINLASLTISQGISINGILSSDYTGVAVSGAGDMNRDGYEEFIVSSPAGNWWCLLYYFGNSSLSNIELTNFNVNQGFSVIGAGIGWAVADVGDINNDGFADIAVGVNYYRIFIIYGKANGFSNIISSSLSLAQGFTLTTDVIIYYGYYTSAVGRPLSGAGDVNGDGYDDIIFGSHYKNKAYIIYGKATDRLANINLDSLTTDQGMLITSSTSIGWSASKLGDINNDGYSDVIIGFT